jgi:hypothetical protein
LAIFAKDPENAKFPPLTYLEPFRGDQAHFQLCKLLSDLRQWNAAFQPLLKKSKRPEGRSIFGMVSLLRLNYLASYLWFAASTSDTQVYYRKYTRELLENAKIAKTLTTIPNEPLSTETFSFDTRLILSMIVVGWNYRHRAQQKGRSMGVCDVGKDYAIDIRY